MDRREAEERALYLKYQGILPPVDNSETVSVKRVLLLFQWSVHMACGLCTIVPVIILYQTLDAPPVWALSWMLCWVLPVPMLLVVSIERALKSVANSRIIICVLYSVLFGSFTIVLIVLNPKGAAFSIWFAGCTTILSFCLVYLTTVWV